ncbi:hypothetical protein [Fictibacillus gelatini]|nr:hypothetical protein [Fictibacillus gelatini]
MRRKSEKEEKQGEYHLGLDTDEDLRKNDFVPGENVQENEAGI